MDRETAMLILKVAPVASFEAAIMAAGTLVDLDLLIEQTPEQESLYRELVRVIADTYMHGPDRPVIVDGEDVTFGYVQQVFLMLEAQHVDDVAYALHRYPREIRCKRAFVRTALYNRIFEQETEVENTMAVNTLAEPRSNSEFGIRNSECKGKT